MVGSIKDRAIRMHPIFQNIFDIHFPVLQTPKTDTRSEDKQEARQKPKRRKDDE